MILENSEIMSDSEAKKEFNEYLKSSPLINNEAFLLKEISDINLGLNEFPLHALSNIKIITKYFKVSRDSQNFKYVNPEVLNSPAFIKSTIAKNPDLYFSISKDNQKMILPSLMKNQKMILPSLMKNKTDYLKYLNEDDYLDKDIAKRVSKDLKNLRESLKYINRNMLNSLLSADKDLTQTGVWGFDVQQCAIFKDVLVPYMKDGVKTSGREWLEQMLTKNPYLYSILDKESEEYKDQRSKDFIVTLVQKYNDLFRHLPEGWKNDINVISRIIEPKKETTLADIRNKDWLIKQVTYNLGSGVQTHVKEVGEIKYHPEVGDITKVLNEIAHPKEFYEDHKDILDMSMKEIRRRYSNLNQEWREQEAIIKSLFKGREYMLINKKYLESIPDEELSKVLIDKMEGSWESGMFGNEWTNLSIVGDTFERTVNHYYMQKHIENENKDMSRPKTKSLKI